MWGPLSKSDRRYYQRRKEEGRARAERQDRLMSDLPRRMAILDRIKKGEISLAEGQKMIRAGREVIRNGGEK